jgi:hypothetical protein
MLEEVAIATGIATEFSATTCPFTACMVPPWFRSITFGPDQKLYGLDHGGNFYLVNEAGPQVVSGVTIPTYVEQVAF